MEKAAGKIGIRGRMYVENDKKKSRNVRGVLCVMLDGKNYRSMLLFCRELHRDIYYIAPYIHETYSRPDTSSRGSKGGIHGGGGYGVGIDVFG